MCTTKGKLTIGYQFFTAISSLISSLFCAYAIVTNDLREEYNKSQDQNCKYIWYYLISMTTLSGIIGLFLTGYLSYRCFCQMVCHRDSALEFSCKRCIFLGCYIIFNFWGYFVSIFLPKECFFELKDEYPKLFGSFILFNTIFTVNLIYVFVLVFNRLCRKKDSLLLNGADSI
jgi:hypothetical protein